jgi:hypothetical protein
MAKDGVKKIHRGRYFLFGFIVCLALIIICTMTGVLATLGSMLPGGSKVNSVTIQSEITKISELATATYTYTNADKYQLNPKKVFGIDLPFTDSSFVVKYDGKIKAGVDMSKVKVSTRGTKVIIKMPDAEILSNEINNIDYLDDSDIFRRISHGDAADFIESQQKVMAKKAEEAGLLKEADKNAKTYLKGLVYKMLPEDYTVEFK